MRAQAGLCVAPLARVVYRQGEQQEASASTRTITLGVHIEHLGLARDIFQGHSTSQNLFASCIMKYQPDIAHQILEGLENFPGLSAPILASEFIEERHEYGHPDLLTDADSWAGAIRYDDFISHCTWLAEDGLVVPWELGSASLLMVNPTGTIPPYGYQEGYSQPQRLTAAGHRYLESVRNKGGLMNAITGAAEQVGREASSIGFRTLLQYLGLT